MNLGKDNGNQSLSGFDDMTFDDMTFDDEPLQDGFQQNNFNNTNINNNQFMQPSMSDMGGTGNINGAVNIGNQQPIQQQPQMQNFNGQSQMQMQQPMQMDTQNVGGKGKKAKKQKAPKQPKAPKPPKPPKQKKIKQQVQQDVNQDYAMALGNQTVNPEDIEKKPLNLKIIIPAIVVVVAAIAGIVVLNMPKNTDKHVTLANNTPAIETPADDNIAGGIVVGENTTDKEEDNEQNTGMTVLKLNEPMKIGVVVNTKLEGDTEYTDHQSYLKVEYSNFVSGYDNVKAYLDEYNETSTNKINLPGKEDFYASSVGNDLVMYEVTVSVPDDFPTNDKKHGYTGLNPEFKFEIKGTEKEDALITRLYEFAIPSVYFIGSDTSSFTIGSTYTLRYMTTMPMDLKADGYELFFLYINDSVTQRYGLASVDIPKNSDVVEVSTEGEETTEALEENTEAESEGNIAENAQEAINDTEEVVAETSADVGDTETVDTEQETE